MNMRRTKQSRFSEYALKNRSNHQNPQIKKLLQMENQNFSSSNDSQKNLKKSESNSSTEEPKPVTLDSISKKYFFDFF